MKMKKTYFLIVLFLCGLSVGNVFASASAAAAATADEVLKQELIDAAAIGDDEEVARLLALASAAEGDLGEEVSEAAKGKEEADEEAAKAVAAPPSTWGPWFRSLFSGAVTAAKGYLEQELRAAAKKGNKPEVEWLIARGTDVNAADQNGWTALMEAAHQGNLPIVERLLAAEAHVNATTDVGNTALMLAAREGHLAVVELLLPYASDEDRAKALQNARERGRTDIAVMIEDFGSGRQTKPTRQPDVAPLPAFEAAVAEANLSDRQVQMLELYNLLMQDDKHYDEEKAFALYKELGRPQIKRAKGPAYKRVIQLRRRAYREKSQ